MPEADTSIRTGWTSGAGENRAHPNPGTAPWRARMRRDGGWSRVTRTSVSGRAVSRVKSSRLISSTGTPALGSVPMTMVMSSPGFVLGQGHVGDVGVVVDARTLDQPEHAPHGGAVEGDRPGQTGPLGQHLDVGAGLARRRHHHLDHPTPLHRATD